MRAEGNDCAPSAGSAGRPSSSRIHRRVTATLPAAKPRRQPPDVGAPSRDRLRFVWQRRKGTPHRQPRYQRQSADVPSSSDRSHVIGITMGLGRNIAPFRATAREGSANERSVEEISLRSAPPRSTMLGSGTYSADVRSLHSSAPVVLSPGRGLPSPCQTRGWSSRRATRRHGVQRKAPTLPTCEHCSSELNSRDIHGRLSQSIRKPLSSLPPGQGSKPEIPDPHAASVMTARSSSLIPGNCGTVFCS